MFHQSQRQLVAAILFVANGLTKQYLVTLKTANKFTLAQNQTYCGSSACADAGVNYAARIDASIVNILHDKIDNAKNAELFQLFKDKKNVQIPKLKNVENRGDKLVLNLLANANVDEHCVAKFFRDFFNQENNNFALLSDPAESLEDTDETIQISDVSVTDGDGFKPCAAITD